MMNGFTKRALTEHAKNFEAALALPLDEGMGWSLAVFDDHAAASLVIPGETEDGLEACAPTLSEAMIMIHQHWKGQTK